MKRLFLLTMILAGMFISCDTDDSPNVETPSVVLNTFQREFPEAKDIDWEKYKENYKVEFEIENIDHTAIIANDGSLIKYKYEILASELPEPVNQTINTTYDRNKIDDTEILKIGEDTYYQVEFDNNFMDDKIIFNPTGEVNADVEYLN
ncbi:hypothetical protein [Zunongwangia sp. H14]|uniref:hypothetical protein n=1 Tax=Zunongwangia sp. H14 TaxID=3240792 RepID=UPI003566C7C3